MKQSILYLIIFVVSHGYCQFNGIFLNTGGCPNFTPAGNIDVEKITSIWTVLGRSRLSTVETRFDCTRFSFILNNNDRSEISIYKRTIGTDTIRGFHSNLGFAVSRRIGYYNLLNVNGIPRINLQGSFWILETDNDSFCIIVLCETKLSIGNSIVYVLIRGTPPDNILQITNNILLANKLNPDGLIWGLDRNC